MGSIGPWTYCPNPNETQVEGCGSPPAGTRTGQILAPGLASARPDVAQQLGGGLVEADYRPLGVIGFGIQVQHVLHMGDEVGAHPGDAPLLFLPRFEEVFLSRRRTVSWDRAGASPNSTTLPANRRRVQWA